MIRNRPRYEWAWAGPKGGHLIRSSASPGPAALNSGKYSLGAHCFGRKKVFVISEA